MAIGIGGTLALSSHLVLFLFLGILRLMPVIQRHRELIRHARIIQGTNYNTCSDSGIQVGQTNQLRATITTLNPRQH